MSIHEVEEGECMASLAETYKFYRWESIYFHEKNKDLRELRPNPEQLKRGDQVFIPDLDDREELCETGKVHRFQLREQPMTDIVLLLEDQGVLLANMKFELSYTAEGSEKTRTGYTDKEGSLEERVPVEVKQAKLSVWTGDDESEEPLVWELKIGDLDPASETSGAQDRLRNLGYDLGDEDDEIGDKTKAALVAFQEAMNIPVSGELDERTLGELEAQADV
jgi:hypothetical protein